MGKLRWVAPGLLVAGAFLVGCTSGVDGPLSTLREGKLKPVTAAVGSPAPEIDGIDTEGEKFKLSEFRGKVVLLDFWSTT
jgi:cytochrome oxidase Cu insertion factor (SCO1/SenC/PrrC family)